jgi:zinc transport system substrate-binding protein
MKYLFWISLFILPLQADKALKIIVSILPQKTWVQKIAGSLVDVDVMVKPNYSPATYEPKPKQMIALSKANIYFAIGVPFENIWLQKFIAQNKKMIVVDISKNIQKQPILKYHHKDLDHHIKQKKYLDPHTWLDPSLVKKEVKVIYNTLQKYLPKYQKQLEKNYLTFLKEIEETDQAIHKLLDNKKENTFIVFHPSWGYFAKAFGLKQIAIEVEGKSPKLRALSHLIKKAKKENAKAIFINPAFSKKTAKILALELNIPVVNINSLSKNWSQNLISVARILAK